jgi:hypothetical protein
MHTMYRNTGDVVRRTYIVTLIEMKKEKQSSEEIFPSSGNVSLIS